MIATLEDFRAYNLSMEIAEEVWDFVSKWQWFEKDTVGKQLVKAVDSIGANLSEGLGRYHYRETINFAYYSRGSLFETKTWLAKSVTRKLISDDQYSALVTKLDALGRMINAYIRSIGNLQEPYIEYVPPDESPMSKT